MKKIYADAHVYDTDGSNFSKELHKVIGNFQDRGLEVEIQYQTTSVFKNNEQVLYSALVIGTGRE